MATGENVFVGLGGNIGDPARRVRQAMLELASLPTTEVVAASSLYRTKPIGLENQPDFINAVVRLRTQLTPDALLGELQHVELRHGRIRREKNGPRTLDLDLLLYDDVVFDSSNMTIPHPRMHERVFVLLPLGEIAPHCIIPGHGPVRDLLSKLPNQGACRVDVA